MFFPYNFYKHYLYLAVPFKNENCVDIDIFIYLFIWIYILREALTSFTVRIKFSAFHIWFYSTYSLE